MIKTITSLILWIIKSLNSIVTWLESEDHSVDMQSKFVDLAPTDEADKAGIYSEMILFATNNAKVYNIALTGPYGSGKSSIIQSFLKKYQRPALNISLAAFVPEAGTANEKATRQEIEGSILQQMLVYFILKCFTPRLVTKKIFSNSALWKIRIITPLTDSVILFSKRYLAVMSIILQSASIKI